ncbi:acyl-CoA N-acyltransferase [Obelidium mucronatum]|nr:acyl-CoA N-acyltransferase [Obelidium mucronatum]
MSTCKTVVLIFCYRYLRVTLQPLDLSFPDSVETNTLFDQLFALISSDKDVDLFQYLRLGPFDSAAALKKVYCQLYTDPTWLIYIVYLNEGNIPIGSFSFIKCSPSDKRVQIGLVWIGTQYLQKGYAAEVSYLMLCHGFENSVAKVQRIEWVAHHLNIPSQKTALKLGFTHEAIFRKHQFYKGMVRDTFVFGMTDEEWVEKKERLKQILALT